MSSSLSLYLWERADTIITSRSWPIIICRDFLQYNILENIFNFFLHLPVTQLFNIILWFLIHCWFLESAYFLQNSTIYSFNALQIIEPKKSSLNEMNWTVDHWWRIWVRRWYQFTNHSRSYLIFSDFESRKCSWLNLNQWEA